MSKDNTFKDEMLRHLVSVNDRMGLLTGAITDKKWSKAADICGEIVFRVGQMSKGLDAKGKEAK